MAENLTYTESMNRLIDHFAKLPGIGRRTAERLAFHVLKSSNDEALGLARCIEDVKKNVRHCSMCFNLTECDPCAVCGDPRRDLLKILVVEQPRDVMSLEAAHAYDGVYHVLLGHVSPLEGVGEADLTIRQLVDRILKLQANGEESVEKTIDDSSDADARNGPALRHVEVILGTNPNMEGDGTAMVVAEQLKELNGITVSRLARGLPTGTQIEYANKSVLSDAISSRQSMI